MRKWIRKNWFASIILVIGGWMLHYTIETFIVSNVLKLAGLGMPILTVI